MSEKSRFLITTADMRSWRSDTPVLFLGEWCRPYDKRGTWGKFDAEVVPPYGWNPGQKESDYIYVHSLCESLLIELCEALNSHHGTKHPSRYWRVVLGTWLHRFTAMVFNRWATIQFALGSYDVSKTVVLDFPWKRLVPLDYFDFARLYRTDAWNHAIYGRILKDWTNIRCKIISVADDSEISGQFTPLPSVTLKQHIKRFVAEKIGIFAEALSRPTDAFFISTYLPFLEECKLQLAFGQIPVPRLSPPGPKVEPDLLRRNQFQLNASGFTGFEKFIREIIPEQIPTCYLEGYPALLELADGLHWPRKPKLIFTSNSFDSDEVFKVWTAAKVEAGVPYIIGQHGANYGTAQFAPSEMHEIATADRYLTWGWEDNCTKHYPVAALPIVGKSSGRWNPRGGLVLVERSGGHREEPWDEVSVFKEYLENQFKFVEKLPDYIGRKVTVRLFSAHLCLNWSENLMWKERRPETRLDLGTEPITKLISKNRLTIFSYNSTGILETLSRNIPTLVFWDPAHWPFRSSARPYFDRLKQAGIFHETPESVSAKVCEIWDDVDGWWRRGDVQAARRTFCDRFARVSRKSIQEFKTALVTTAPAILQ